MLTIEGNNSLTTGKNFRWVKISPMAHTSYCDKNFAKLPSAKGIQEVVVGPIEAQRTVRAGAA